GQRLGGRVSDSFRESGRAAVLERGASCVAPVAAGGRVDWRDRARNRAVSGPFICGRTADPFRRTSDRDSDGRDRRTVDSEYRRRRRIAVFPRSDASPPHPPAETRQIDRRKLIRIDIIPVQALLEDPWKRRHSSVPKKVLLFSWSER